MKRFGAAYSLTAACTLILLSALWSQNIGYQQDPAWHAPAEFASRPNPLALKSQAVGGGKKLFARNCVQCHGEDGSGLVKKHSADLQLSVVQNQSDGMLFWKITNGNPDRGMPSFSKLPELQRWQLVLYLRTLHPSPSSDGGASGTAQR
jgi:mono/diheme cytochrome c family protein